jgi:hypothetical protein
MAKDLTIPDATTDDAEFERAVRILLDHLLGAVDVDLEITLAGRPFVIAWADRRPTDADEVTVAMTAGMRVVEGRGGAPPEVLPTGEEQITIVIDGERLVFHLMTVERDQPRAGDAARKALR